MINIEQFTRVYTAKIKFNKKSRLSAIQEYFATEHDLQLSFEDDSNKALERILEYSSSEPNKEQEIFNDIINLLHDRYSMGEAFIVYNLNTTLSFDEVSNSITEMAEEKLDYEMFEFEFSNVNVDSLSKEIKIKFKYKEYQKDIANNLRSDIVNNSGQIPLIIEMNSNKVLVHTGYNKASNHLIKLINDSTLIFSISEIKVKNDVSRMPNLVVNNSFNPISILSLNLLLSSLNSNQYLVQDILSISFNNEDAPRVKKARLGGTNLLEDADVIHRIYRGDSITNFIVEVLHLNEIGEVDLIAEIHVDFRNELKLTFYNAQPINYTVELATLDLEQIIRKVINSQETVIKTDDLINTNLPLLQANNTELVSDVLKRIKEELKNKVDASAKTEIDEYFRVNYQL